MLRPLALATATLLLALPAPAAAQELGLDATVRFTGEENPFSRLRLEIRLSFSGPPAANVRAQVDQAMGDGDGRVSEAEAQRAEDDFRDRLSRDPSETIGADITIDGARGREPQIREIELEGFAGPASSEATFTLSAVAEAIFTPSPGSRHELAIPDSGEGDDEGHYSEVRLVYEAPPGYVIEETKGMPEGAVLSRDQRTLTLTSVPDSPQAVIVFAKAKAAPAPVAAPLLALAAVALLRRRVAQAQK